MKALVAKYSEKDLRTRSSSPPKHHKRRIIAALHCAMMDHGAPLEVIQIFH
jgi:hypothetical protein